MNCTWDAGRAARVALLKASLRAVRHRHHLALRGIGGVHPALPLPPHVRIERVNPIEPGLRAAAAAAAAAAPPPPP